MTGFVIFIVVMIVLGLISTARQQSAKAKGTPNPRVQKLMERMQAEAQRNGGPPPVQYRPTALQPPAPWQQPTQAPIQPRIQAQIQAPPGHRPPQNHLPVSKDDLDAQVRELMSTGQEVAAIRLLCDERDLGILEAQEYARTLVTPAAIPGKPAPAPSSEPDDEDESRYVGSAAFAESIFDRDREENVWASGWVDTPEPEDRSDMDELWEIVRNPPRPGATQAS